MGARPVAYLLSFRCYGSWLPGDRRGWVSRHGGNVAGTPLMAPSGALADDAAARQSQPSFWLGEQARATVCRTVEEVAAFRGWHVEALSVRTSHVHAVLRADVPPERALTQLKAWSTRRLVEAKLAYQGQKVWSEHGSTKYLWDERGVRRVKYYVNHEQDDPRVYWDPRSPKYRGG